MLTWITEKIIPLIIPFNIYIAIFQLFYVPSTYKNDHELFANKKVAEIFLLKNSPFSPFKVESSNKFSIDNNYESFKSKEFFFDLYLLSRSDYLPTNTFLEYNENIQDYVLIYILYTNNIDFHSPPSLLV